MAVRTKEIDNVTALSSEQPATGIPTCVEGGDKDNIYVTFTGFLLSSFQFQFNVNITISVCLHGVINKVY